MILAIIDESSPPLYNRPIESVSRCFPMISLSLSTISKVLLPMPSISGFIYFNNIKSGLSSHYFDESLFLLMM